MDQLSPGSNIVRVLFHPPRGAWGILDAARQRSRGRATLRMLRSCGGLFKDPQDSAPIGPEFWPPEQVDNTRVYMTTVLPQLAHRADCPIHQSTTRPPPCEREPLGGSHPLAATTSKS